MLRNLTSVYIISLGIIYGSVIVFSIYSFRVVKIDVLNLSYLIYLLTGMIAAIYTVASYGLSIGLYAAVRYFLVMPIAIVSYTSLCNEKDMERFLKYFVFFIAIGTLTLPIQYIIGPISWFSEPGERAGLVRFASMFGNLTVIGIVSPLAFFLLMTLKINRYGKIIIGIVLISGILLSLQKSALMGFLMGIVIYIVVFAKNIKAKMIFKPIVSIIILLFIIGFTTYKNNLPFINALRYMYYIAGVGDEDYDTSKVVDDTVIASVVRRLTELPGSSLRDLYDKNGLLGFAIGGSFDMLGNSLMMEGETEYVMPHNNIVDYVVVGGVFHLISFFGILYGLVQSIRIHIKKSVGYWENENIYRSIYGIIILFIINMPFSSCIQFQPNIGSLIWVIIGFVSRQNFELSREFVVEHPSSAK